MLSNHPSHVPRAIAVFEESGLPTVGPEGRCDRGRHSPCAAEQLGRELCAVRRREEQLVRAAHVAPRTRGRAVRVFVACAIIRAQTPSVLLVPELPVGGNCGSGAIGRTRVLGQFQANVDKEARRRVDAHVATRLEEVIK